MWLIQWCENASSHTTEGRSNPARGQESEASRSPSALLPFLLSGRAAPSVVAVEPRTPLNAQDTGCGASTTLLNSLVIAPGTRSHERSGHLPHQQGQRPQWRRRSHFSITLSTAKDSVLPPRRLTAQTEHFLCSHVLAHLPTVRGPLGYLHFRPPLLFLSLSLLFRPTCPLVQTTAALWELSANEVTPGAIGGIVVICYWLRQEEEKSTHSSQRGAKTLTAQKETSALDSPPPSQQHHGPRRCVSASCR